jgi:hypothetical protein
MMLSRIAAARRVVSVALSSRWVFVKAALSLGILLRLEDVSQVECGDGVQLKKLLAQIEEVRKFDAAEKVSALSY